MLCSPRPVRHCELAFSPRAPARCQSRANRQHNAPCRSAREMALTLVGPSTCSLRSLARGHHSSLPAPEKNGGGKHPGIETTGLRTRSMSSIAERCGRENASGIETQRLWAISGAAGRMCHIRPLSKPRRRGYSCSSFISPVSIYQMRSPMLVTWSAMRSRYTPIKSREIAWAVRLGSRWIYSMSSSCRER